MAKKKRTKEDILEDIRNYKPKMTEGMSQKEFYARMGTNCLQDKGKEDMIQTIPAPTRPHFIFDRKMWEIENEYKAISEKSSCSKIIFENILKTTMIDPDIGFNEEHNALTMTEVVRVMIRSQFDEPEITMFIKNTGTMVGKERDNGKIKEIAPLSLPLFVIEKLVKVAVIIDKENRDAQDEFKDKLE